MDDFANQILHGCCLAGELKENLHNLVNQSHHHLLISSCEEIVKTFTEAIQKLSAKEERSSSHGFSDMESASESDQEETHLEQPEKEMGLSEQGLGSPAAMKNLETVITAATCIETMKPIRRGVPSTDAVIIVSSTSEEASEVASYRISSEKKKKKKSGTSEEASEVLSSEVLSSKISSDEEKKKKKRRERLKRSLGHLETIRVTCDEGSNLPPDDGYTWRKYGQKDIPGSKFPRGYYRCTHRHSSYGCQAIKQVQRLDDDPTTYQIFYRGTHSCGFGGPRLKIPSTNYVEHKSQGEPPAPCPTSPSLSTSIQLGSWFSGEVECSRTDAVACPKPRTGNEADVSHDGDSSESSVHAISR